MRTSHTGNALVSILFAAFAAAAFGEDADFPIGSTRVEGERLIDAVRGKTFGSTTATGKPRRLSFEGDGVVWVNVDSGRRQHQSATKGAWRVDGSKFCMSFRDEPEQCREARLLPGDKGFVTQKVEGGLLTFEKL